MSVRTRRAVTHGHQALTPREYTAHLALKRQAHAWDKWRTPDVIQHKGSYAVQTFGEDRYEMMARRAELEMKRRGVEQACEPSPPASVPSQSRNPIEPGDPLGARSVGPPAAAHTQLRNSSHMQTQESVQKPKVEVRRKHYLPTGVTAPPADPTLIGDPTPPYMPAPAPEIDDSLDTPEKSLRTLKWAETEARKLMKMEQEKARPSASAMVAYIDKVIKSQEAQVKVRGEIKRRKEEMPEEWKDVRDRIIGALQPYPQALKAVIEALTKK